MPQYCAAECDYFPTLVSLYQSRPRTAVFPPKKLYLVTSGRIRPRRVLTSHIGARRNTCRSTAPPRRSTRSSRGTASIPDVHVSYAFVYNFSCSKVILQRTEFSKSVPGALPAPFELRHASTAPPRPSTRSSRGTPFLGNRNDSLT